MLQPGRNFSTDNYRFGFNGKEKDDEVKGGGNSINYDARIQDTRLGRFLSVDPLEKNYPSYSPYQFAGNKPIQAIDLDGLEEVDYRIIRANQDGGARVTVTRTDNTNSNSNNGKLLIHKYDENRKFVGNYIQFEYKELNDLFLTDDNRNPTVKKFNPNPENPINSQNNFYSFALEKSKLDPYIKNGQAQVLEHAPNQVVDATSVISLGIDVKERLTETPGNNIGTSFDPTPFSNPVQASQFVFNSAASIINSTQSQYGQNASQVKTIDIGISNDMHNKVDLNSLQNQLQSAYPNASIKISNTGDHPASGYVSYEGTTQNAEPRKAQ